MEEKEIILPGEYKRLKYLESHGRESFSSKVLYDSTKDTYKVETIIAWSNLGKRSLFGRNSEASYFGVKENGYYECSYIDTKIKASFEKDKPDSVIYYDDCIDKTIDVNGETFTRYNRQNTYAKSEGYMFGIDGGYEACACVYRYKEYKNDIIMRDFIPAVRKADDEYGMYDLISNTFFTNESGYGAFTGGN